MPPDFIASAIGANRSSTPRIAPCPAYDGSCLSLAVTQGLDLEVLVHCHADCDLRDVVAALSERGLWDDTGKRAECTYPKCQRNLRIGPDPNFNGRADAALAISRTAQVITGSHAKTYLRSCGMVLSPWPSLSFHLGSKHSSDSCLPAMVALVVHGETATPVGVRHAFLARDGREKTLVDLAKMMHEPCRCSVIRLCEPADSLMVGEGIETSLGAVKATGEPASSALSTSGLRSRVLPGVVAEVIVLADGNEPCEAAALCCAQQWLPDWRHVQIARPPKSKDFDDLLMTGNSILMECA